MQGDGATLVPLLCGRRTQEMLWRRLALLMVAASMAVMVLAFAGVALAAVITCTGGRCEGTNEDDVITGTDQRDRIFASPAPASTMCSPGPARTSSTAVPAATTWEA